MSDQPTVARYSLVDAVSEAPESSVRSSPTASVAPSERSSAEEGGWVHRLTVGILAVCLGLWALIGFFFWVPVLVRSMLRFSVALIQSMLEGTAPFESGRVLRESVDFYRRGFAVAIGAVLGDLPDGQRHGSKVGTRRFLKEIAWALVVWYVLLLAVGVVEFSPLDLWRFVVGYPWFDRAMAVGEAIEGALGGLGGAAPDSIVP